MDDPYNETQCRYIVREPRSTREIGNYNFLMYVWVPEVGNTGLVAQSVGSIGRSNPEVVGSNPTEVKFSLTRGDSQIAFKGVIPRGDLVYRQYRLLPAPKHTLKNETQLQTELGKYIFFIKVCLHAPR